MSYDTVTIQAQRLGESGRDFAQRVMQVIVIKNGCDDDDAGDVDDYEDDAGDDDAGENDGDDDDGDGEDVGEDLDGDLIR